MNCHHTTRIIQLLTDVQQKHMTALSNT